MNEKPCRNAVAERERGQCARCGAFAQLTLHHRKKRSQGGGWDLFNCVLVCGHGTAGCHGWIEHHPKEAEAEGFHVRPWQNPAEIPVLYRGRKAMLTEDGEVEWI